MLAVNNLCIERNGRAIIQDLSFTLEGQKRLFVQGEIGSGKTTLLLALLVFVFKMPMINFLAQQCWMILPSGH